MTDLRQRELRDPFFFAEGVTTWPAVDLEPGLLRFLEHAKQVVLDTAAAVANGSDEEVSALLSIPTIHVLAIVNLT